MLHASTPESADSATDTPNGAVWISFWLELTIEHQLTPDRGVFVAHSEVRGTPGLPGATADPSTALRCGRDDSALGVRAVVAGLGFGVNGWPFGGLVAIKHPALNLTYMGPRSRSLRNVPLVVIRYRRAGVHERLEF